MEEEIIPGNNRNSPRLGWGQRGGNQGVGAGEWELGSGSPGVKRVGSSKVDVVLDRCLL